MNWETIEKAYASSFTRDIDVRRWAGTNHDVSIKRSQEWTIRNGANFFLSSDMDVRDIYLDYSVISKEWQKAFGIPKLRDFIEPVDRKKISDAVTIVSRNKPWRVYAGKDECQYMYYIILKIVDVAMRYICSLYPRDCNEAFVLGDAGCSVGGKCPGHGGAHNGRRVIDLNYCTFKGFNMTHYRRKNMPSKYSGSNINTWQDPYPMRKLKTDVFDVEKNYALYRLLWKIFPRGQFMTSVGINNTFKKIYGSSPMSGDDVEHYRHYWHVHLYFGEKINWDAEITNSAELK